MAKPKPKPATDRQVARRTRQVEKTGTTLPSKQDVIDALRESVGEPHD